MKIAALLSAIIIATTSWAQTISGRVTDQDLNPLPGCNVYIKDTYYGASTLEDGTFSFRANLKDSAVLVVEFMGFEDFVQSFSISSATKPFKVKLKEEFSTLNAVTVTAGTYGTGEAAEAVVLSSLDVVTTAGALGDIAAAMQMLPGTATNGESGRLFVHGGSANETGTYIDGILVHQPYTSSVPNMAVRGRFNPFMFSGTSFSTGGYSAEYGQALSSVLILNTNEMPVEETWNFSIMSVGLDAAGTKMWKDGAITVSANYMNLKPYMALIPQNYTWNQEPQAFGGAMNFRQKTKGNGMLKVYATMDQSNLSQNQAVTGEDQNKNRIDLTNNNRFVNANWKGMLNNQWVVKTGASFTYNTDLFDLSSLAITEKLKGSHAKMMAIYEANSRTHIRFGTEYFYKSFETSFADKESGRDSLIGIEDHKPVAFAEAEYYVSSDLVFKAGMRSEYSSYLASSNWSPRLSAAYALNAKNTISLAYGWFYQDPINKQLLGHTGLTYEKATHYVMSYSKEMQHRTLRAEMYYKNYDQLVKYQNVAAPFTNDGNGFAYGVDVYFRDRKTIKNGDFWISYSYLNSQRDYLNYPEAARPSFANAHNISIVYKHWIEAWRSQIGATVSYGSPRPHNNPNQAAFMADELRPYRSVDLNWSFLFRDNIIFHAAISNVFGFQNVFGYNYSPMPNASGTFARTPVLPAANQFFFVGCFITLSKSGKENQLDKIQ